MITDIGDIELASDFIAFRFKEHVNVAGMFEEQGSGIIYIPNNSSHKTSASNHRFATVIKVGPDVKEAAIVPGATILIEHLQWSLGIGLSGTEEKFHVTKESEVIAILED